MARRDRAWRCMSRGQVGREFGRFLIAGAINTALTYGLYLILLDPLGYFVAYSVAYVVGIVVSYFLVSRFVFRTSTSLAGFFRYPLVYVAQYLVGTLVLWMCVELAGVGKEIALLASIAATVPVTFAISRLVLNPRPG
jgi:putative flippase GtrA